MAVNGGVFLSLLTIVNIDLSSEMTGYYNKALGETYIASHQLSIDASCFVCVPLALL